MTEGFWGPRMETNIDVSLPKFLELMEQHGTVDNFRRLSGRKDVEYRQASFMSDSDLYKWIEAACLALQSYDRPELQQTVETLIDEIATAQDDHGYVATHIDRAERFKKLEHSHELYCVGHMIQAAVAHHRTTGTDNFLQAARRFADYIVATFGPEKIETTDGHPEIEMALIELYRTTGEQSYLDLAGFFLSQPQSQHNLPPIAQRPELVGHAVRSGYICCGGADWYAETGDANMLDNLQRLWTDLTERKIYITGGVGAHHKLEDFGEPYELPNLRAYAETCAQIAHIMWAWRMLMVTGEAKYADLIETILYNGFLSGISLAGTEYFYMNPLASGGGYQRSAWFGCNCCPPNVQRMLAGLPGYMFATGDQGIYVFLYDRCQATLAAPDGTPLRLQMETNYPWENSVEITLHPQQPIEFTLFLRIPGWTRDIQGEVNGQPISSEQLQPGSYLPIKRRWVAGDKLHLGMPMPVRLMESHPRILENRGCIALQRGPIVYCFESTDNPEATVADLTARVDPSDPEGGFEAQWQPELLGGVMTIQGEGSTIPPEEGPRPLYHPVGTVTPARRQKVALTAIPYYAWANRGEAAMRVWIPKHSAT